MNPSRRITLTTILAIFGPWLSTPVSHAADPRPDPARPHPNILFIAIDDLNDWISPLGGHAQSRTPNIARLAARGLLFTNAHCAAPACNPSRAALMTGIRPSASGVYFNTQPWRKSPRLKNAPTLPQFLRRHGYKAIGSGKIFHGRFPDPASWDEYWPSKSNQRPNDPTPSGRPLNGIPRTSHFDWGPLDAPESSMGDTKVADWVSNQLSIRHAKPLFLACGFFRPHLPWYVPESFFDDFPLDSIQLPKVPADDLDDVPPAGRRMAKPAGDHAKVVKHGQWKNAVQAYLASIRFVDRQLGKVLDALDRGPMKDNTIIVFWTDHGWHLGEKSHWRKFTLWEEATRTPVIIAAPGLTRANSRTGQPVSLLDLYPTIVSLAGLPADPSLHGHDLTPLLKNPGTTDWPHVSLTTHGRNNHAIRDTRHRYIRYADGSEELYDHQSDPAEYHNLADNPKFKTIKAKLATFLPTDNAPDSPKH